MLIRTENLTEDTRDTEFKLYALTCVLSVFLFLAFATQVRNNFLEPQNIFENSHPKLQQRDTNGKFKKSVNYLLWRRLNFTVCVYENLRETRHVTSRGGNLSFFGIGIAFE